MYPQVLDAMAARHCKRAFLDRAVPRETLEAVLTAAAQAPSSNNVQPWSVAVVTGAARRRLSEVLCDAWDRGVPPRPDYLNRPEPLGPEAAARSRAYGEEMFGLKGIDRDDAEARHAHVRENFRFFGAPVELIFHLGSDAVPGSFLATGCFIQNVMLGLVAHGLGSCPQYSVAGYAGLVREVLGLDGRLIVCGMAVGWVDGAATVNSLVPRRAPLGEYVTWYD
jgi:nitroreductase